VVAGSELVVAREAHANNTSKYLLNGRTSNFTEVTEIFKEKGVDLDNNRFLILQGEVEQISMMKPKAQGPHDEGLLEYLEDIIGSNKYVERIEAGGKECVPSSPPLPRPHPPRLEELNEQRVSMVKRLKVVEKEREGLEGGKAEAEAYVAQERELLRWRAALFQLYLGESSANVAKLEAAKAEMEAKLAHERTKHATHQQTLGSSESAHAEAAAAHEALRREVESVSGVFKEFERKDVKAREDLKYAKQKGKKLDERIAADGARRAELEARAAALAAEVPALEARRSAAEQQLVQEEARLEALLAGLSGELAELGSQLAQVETELAPWAARVAEAQARCDLARAERDLLAGRAEAAARRAADARAGAAAAEAEASAAEAEAGKLSKGAAAGKAAAAAARAAEAAARAADEAASAKLGGSRGRLEERRSGAAEASGRSSLLKALLAAKASGAIPGILGRLGDLGAIDKRYDVAVSTAAGALDHIVVETTEAAQRCVELLRQRKLGVATFLILDRQRGLAAEAERPAGPLPEGAQRLVDLVRPAEARLRTAFYFALRSTLVVADLGAARRIAYGKETAAAHRRVVTLEGQLIESSGTMSGGGGRPRGGRMATGASAPALSAASEAADAEGALKAAQAEWEADKAAAERCASQLAAASAAAAAADEAVEAAARRLSKLQLAVASLRAKAADLRSQQAALDAAASPSAEDAARLAEVRSELDAAVLALAEAKSGCSGLTAKAASLRKAMEEAGGLKLKNARAAVARLSAEIETAGADAAGRRANAAAAEKAAAKLVKSLEEAAAERTAHAAETEAKKADFAALEAKALEVLEQVRASSELMEAKAAELARLKAAHEEATRAVSEWRKVELVIGAKLEDLGRDSKAEADKARHWDKKLAAVRKERMEATGAAELPALLTEEELEAQTSEAALEAVTLLEAELSSAHPDMGAIAAWRAKEDEYCRRADELRALTERRDGARGAHDALRKRRLDEFMAGFNTISLRLKEMYQMITLGGDAELELVDSLDPFSEGLVFSVRPPKKSWKNIANLSGGEKTLSSLALVFALHHFKPTPLYVMDEIDAALDFKNVSIVAHYIKERTRDAQFVIISLRNNMFELADRLVGIYKARQAGRARCPASPSPQTENCTKSITIAPGAFAVGRAPTAPPAVEAN